MKKSKDSLGDRMKGYEKVSRAYLQKRMPTLIRLDGKAFHTYTRGFERPFDSLFQGAMIRTAQRLVENIQGCKLAYVQSDEISLLLTDYDKLTTNSWFDKNIQKMTSISASMATLYFNQAMLEGFTDLMNRMPLVEECERLASMYHKKILNGALFDSRVWSMTKDEVCNQFIWRQQDCTRNAINMVAQSYFSPKSLHGVNNNVKQDMLFKEHGINFNDYPTHQKRGACVYRKDGSVFVDVEIPVFTQDREFIEQFVYLDRVEKEVYPPKTIPRPPTVTFVKGPFGTLAMEENKE